MAGGKSLSHWKQDINLGIIAINLLCEFYNSDFLLKAG